mmetsp:Transcript_15621/g.25562  ORF Transcript_15621/g.25562 Transcript_15621/m.25562 type:complete len:85 (+) Transcript_15621:410-664(+)
MFPSDVLDDFVDQLTCEKCTQAWSAMVYYLKHYHQAQTFEQLFVTGLTKNSFAQLFCRKKITITAKKALCLEHESVWSSGMILP